MPMLLHIRGYHPPGREWQARDERYDNIHVGIQIGKQPHGLVAGDAESPSWTIPVEVVTREEGLDFRGPSVQGRRGERFIYLTWGDVGKDGSFAMFRRAKLMLSELEAFAGNAESVIARVDLTDKRGGPQCARLKPPALTLERGG